METGRGEIKITTSQGRAEQGTEVFWCLRQLAIGGGETIWEKWLGNEGIESGWGERKLSEKAFVQGTSPVSKREKKPRRGVTLTAKWDSSIAQNLIKNSGEHKSGVAVNVQGGRVRVETKGGKGGVTVREGDRELLSPWSGQLKCRLAKKNEKLKRFKVNKNRP